MTTAQYEAMRTLRSEFAKTDDCPRMWKVNATPAEREVFMKYKHQGKRRAAVGGALGASTMAGVWKLSAMGTGLGVAGMIAGGVVGAAVSMRTGGIRREMFSEFLKLPADKSPRAARAREILETKLPNNAFVQELLKEANHAPNTNDPWAQEPPAPSSSKTD